MAGTKVTAKAVDFSNVKDQGNFNTKRVPAGDYLAKIVKVEDAESKKDKAFQYLFTIKLVKFSQHSYPYYCKLQENQLWKLRNLLVAAGMTVPKKRMKLDPSKVVGKTIGVTMEDDEYEDKEKSVVGSVFPASELSDSGIDISDDTDDDDGDEGDEGEYEDDSADEADETDDDAGEDEDDEEGDDDSSDEFEDMDRTALKKFINSKDDSFKFKKSQTDDELRAKARELAGSDSDSDDDELEELDIDDL